MRFNKTIHNGAALALLSILNTTNAFSGTMGPVESDFKNRLVIQGGGFWASQGQNQHISIVGMRGNEYTATNDTQGNGLFGLGYYLDGYATNRFQLIYGLDAFYLPSTSVQGTILVENIFPTLAYSYKIQNVPLYAAAKALIYTNNDKYNITVDAGIGPNFMNITGYNEAVIQNGAVPQNNFSSHDQVTFSATVGAGVRFNNILGKFPLECGYRFFYLGQGQLTINNDQYLNALKTGDNYANAVVCSTTI